MDVQIQKQNMETYQMDGRVEVFPDQSVVLNISDQKVIFFLIIHKLDEVLLGDVAGAEVSDPVDWHDPNVLNGTKQILVERQSDVEKVETNCEYHGRQI